MGRRRKSKQGPAASSKGKQKLTKFDSQLATIMLAKGFVSSTEEALCLAETIIAEIEESELSREQACIASFEDYFSLSHIDATKILPDILDLRVEKDITDDKSLSDKGSEELVENEGEAESGDDDGEYIDEGECELCERQIRLTRHHLIPRSTWPKILPRCLNAAEALSKNDVHRAGLILGAGLHHLLEPLAKVDMDKVAVKALLQTTTNICSPCHRAVHRTHDNMELANNFSTVEQLLEDEEVYKYVRWASKQRPGKHAV